MSTDYRPYTLIAELTYRCPLRCGYCSNPVNYADYGVEMETATWLRVFREAEALGVMQLNVTGGEPLLREDLEALIEGANTLNLYTNLITSGIPLTKERLASLRSAGLNSVQVSLQSLSDDESDRMAGLRSVNRKLAVAEWVKALGLPLTINVVLHRGNLHEVPEIIALAERLSADRLELANTQYLGWALLNRQALLPTQEQLERARVIAAEAQTRLRGIMEVLFVLPDYYAAFPKSCMDGWGRRFILVTPNGLALPCHLAHTLPGLQFDHVQDHSLGAIWSESLGFNQFRGEGWLPDPCRSCQRRTIDYGGCRCQAFHLTGQAGVTDPACFLSPDHSLIEAARVHAMELTGRPVRVEYRHAKSTTH